MKFTEERLINFAAPLSATEEQQCKNAIGMVRDALKGLGFTDDNKLIMPLVENTFAFSLDMRTADNSRKVKIFLQGSYANNTNIRTQSDVDIAVVEENVFTTKYRTDGYYPQTDKTFNFSAVPPRSVSFKDEVESCLTQKFHNDVERKNKSIKVHGNSYRKDADTVPCRRYRDYRGNYDNDAENYVGAIIIFTDDNQKIINYPEQHIANGKKKNVATNFWYKKMVRIIKNMKLQMSNAGYSSADEMSSFGLESLLWNIPDDVFLKYYIYRFGFGEIVDYLYLNKMHVIHYKEANGIKPLAPKHEDITRYTKFINDLNQFYQYDV